VVGDFVVVADGFVDFVVVDYSADCRRHLVLPAVDSQKPGLCCCKGSPAQSTV